MSISELRLTAFEKHIDSHRSHRSQPASYLGLDFSQVFLRWPVAELKQPPSGLWLAVQLEEHKLITGWELNRESALGNPPTISEVLRSGPPRQKGQWPSHLFWGPDATSKPGLAARDDLLHQQWQHPLWSPSQTELTHAVHTTQGRQHVRCVHSAELAAAAQTRPNASLVLRRL